MPYLELKQLVNSYREMLSIAIKQGRGLSDPEIHAAWDFYKIILRQLRQMEVLMLYTPHLFN